jgi:hypothetical protein
LDNFVRVEWVDDSSVNLIYDTQEAALAALHAFTSEQIDSFNTPLAIERRAKDFATAEKPDEQIHLRVRQAHTSDVKKRGARDASRFYLLNPHKDPRERKFKERRQRPRRASDEDGDYSRRRFDDREHKRRRQDDALDASMYDDDATAISADDTDRGKRVRFGKRNEEDLFAGRTDGRLRDRSASPARDGDGRYGFGSDPDDSSIRRKIRQRSLTPPRQRNTQPSNIHAINNSGKELFAKSARGTALAPSPAFTKELFPDRASPPKELFPNKKAGHRRSKAIDESPDRYDSSRPRSLADRISGGASYGRLRSDSSTDVDELNIRGAAPISVRGAAPVSFKGAARKQDNFNIRGAAQSPDEDLMAPAVKELFPLRAGGNVGKELFAQKIKGRGGPRPAADSFF